MAQTGGEQRIFLRKASGLIRTASGTDTFIYNLGLVSVGLGVASILFYGPAYYPGGDLVWSCLLAGVCMAMIALRDLATNGRRPVHISNSTSPSE